MRVLIVLISTFFCLTSCGNAEESLPLKPGVVFKDCAECPEMVVIPAGEFVMGAREYDLKLATKREQPQRIITIPQDFAMGTHEVTRYEYLKCVGVGACTYNPPVMAWETQEPIDLQAWPIVHISWDDAQVYVEWLSEETGHQYSLPSEAEWEYAARGGTTTIYWWGDELERGHAHCAYCGGGSIFRGDHRMPVRVGSFPPNPFGLYDMVGNVKEHVADCLSSDLSILPSNGSAYVEEGCKLYSARGGTFVGASSRYTRLSARRSSNKGSRSPYTGFRVKRTIHPHGK